MKENYASSLKKIRFSALDLYPGTGYPAYSYVRKTCGNWPSFPIWEAAKESSSVLGPTTKAFFIYQKKSSV